MPRLERWGAPGFKPASALLVQYGQYRDGFDLRPLAVQLGNIAGVSGYGFPLSHGSSLGRFAAQLAGFRHAVVQGDGIEIETVRPSERAKLHEDTGEKRRVLE